MCEYAHVVKRYGTRTIRAVDIHIRCGRTAGKLLRIGDIHTAIRRFYFELFTVMIIAIYGNKAIGDS